MGGHAEEMMEEIKKCEENQKAIMEKIGDRANQVQMETEESIEDIFKEKVEQTKKEKSKKSSKKTRREKSKENEKKKSREKEKSKEKISEERKSVTNLKFVNCVVKKLSRIKRFCL